MRFKTGTRVSRRMDLRLTLTHTGKGFAIGGRTAKDVDLTFDNPPEGTYGASPMEHLLGAFAACALMDVDLILRKKRLAFSNLRCECVGARPDAGDVKPFTDIRLVFRVDGEVPKKAFDDAVRLSVDKYCSVGATLKVPPTVSYEARVGP